MTRHNAGFITVDELAKLCGCDVNKKKHNALYGMCGIGGHCCLLVKPQTYMNNYVEAVGALGKFYKIPAERVIIKSIALHIGDGYPRIKIGVGKKPHPDYDLAAWVLSKFTEQERGALDTAVQNACKAVQLMVSGETDKAMNLYNS